MKPRMPIVAATLVLLLTVVTLAADPTPIDKGQRVLSAGHSFHVFMPNILKELAQAGGVKDHVQVDLQSIGGSRVIQHWDLADEKNKAKTALKTGKVDVFTLSPIFLPDDGIANFTKLALEHNPNIRITVQEFWMPYDRPEKDKTSKPDRNARTAAELDEMHAAYFKSMDAQVVELNKQHGKEVLYVVPVGQAVIGLRKKIIAGEAPGVKTQEELFTDPIGHVRPPIQVLNAYCHYAVIYRKSPVGLPMPGLLEKAKNPDWDAKLNKLLQELAWEAVKNHPLSGVKEK